MADDSGERRDARSGLSDLEERLERARAKSSSVEDPSGDGRPERDNTAYGQAFQVSAEMIAGIGVGGGAGWMLDRWLDTSPALLMLCLVLGFAAGLANVFRSLRGAGHFGSGKPPSDPSIPSSGA